MCGIAGIFSYRADALSVDRNELASISEAQRARGPDGSGIWESPDRRVALAHRRLAVIDLSEAASQPMLSADASEVVTFNGEIYNFRALRRDLERQGVRFRTDSDTELILELYRHYGVRMLDMMRGMFAFAIWDATRRELFAARDPFGIKPLYFIDDGRVFRFASQVKALRRANAVRLTPDPAGHVGFFIFGFIPDPYTLYREVRALPAGHYLRVCEGGRLSVTRYYDVGIRLAEATDCRRFLSNGEKTEIVRGALADTLSAHLVSDVQVGVFLSAGIDSNVIAGSIAKQVGGEQIRTLTLGFEEFVGTPMDEVPLAEAQARKFGAMHTTKRICEGDFFASLDLIWESMDQPSIDGINTWLVSRAAAEAGLKVCLSGVGGDELFGGYSSFSQVPRLARALSKLSIPQAVASFFRDAVKFVPEQILSPKISGLLDYGATITGSYLLRRGMFLPEELGRLLDASIVAEGLEELRPIAQLEALTRGIGDDRAKVASLELGWYMRHQLLRDADWASMAHGLELRTPLVDRGFFEAVLPAIVATEPATKANLLDCIPEELSRNISGRKKTGFVTPVRTWLNGRYTKSASNRGLRGWARVVYAQFVPELSLGPSEPIPPRLTEKKPVIVYRIGQLGDTLISLPAFKSIRACYPSDQIVLLTDRHPSRGHYVSAWDVLGPTGLLDGVIYYSVTRGYWANLWTYFWLVFKLRELSPKQVINLAPRVRNNDIQRDAVFFKLLVGADRYLALPASGSNANSTRQAVSSKREWQRLLDLVADGDTVQMYELSLPPWAVNEARLALNAIGDSSDNWVAIAPGSKMPAKRWSRERFGALGKIILSEDRDVKLLIIGGSEDKELGNLLCAEWGDRTANLAGSLSIFGSAAILKHCKAYIGNDSGVMHLAAQVGTPCVAIFSARDIPGKWEPYGDGHQVLRQAIDCAGCMLEVCNRGNECLESISVESVLSAFHKINYAVSRPSIQR